MGKKRQFIWMFIGYSLFFFVLITSFYSSIILEGLPYIESDEQLVYRVVSLCIYIVVFALFVMLSRWKNVWNYLCERLRVGQLVGLTLTCALVGALLLNPWAIHVLGLYPSLLIGTSFISIALAPMQLFWLTHLVHLSYRGSYGVILGVNAIATILNAVMLIFIEVNHGVVTLVAFLLSGLCAIQSQRGDGRWIVFDRGSVPLNDSSARSESGISLSSASRSYGLGEDGEDGKDVVAASNLSSGQIPIIISLLRGGVLAVGLFAGISGLMSILSGQTATTPSALQGFMLIAGISVTAIMALPVLITKRPLQLENSYRLALPLSALGFLVVPQLIGTLPDGVPGVLVATGYMMVGIVLYCTIAEVARTAQVSPALLNAASGVIILTCNLLGILAALLLGPFLASQQDGFATLALALLYLMILGGSWLIGKLRNKDTLRQNVSEETSALNEEANPGALGELPVADIADSEPLRKTDAEIADSLGLSSKESEVLTRLLHGRTLSRIGEELFLSTSAVKYHTQNIYHKVKVNSREELIRVIHSKEQMAETSLEFRKKHAHDLAQRIATEQRLTERERDVLYNYALGNTISKTAESMGVSENTVKTHAKRLYSKLGVHSKQGIIDLL